MRPRTVGDGFGCLMQGFRVIGTQPRLFLLGMVPPLVLSVLLLAAYVAFVLNVGAFSGWLLGLLPWEVGGALQVVLAIVLGIGVLLVMVLTFSTLTLALGAPVYDVISAGVDRWAGPVPEEASEPMARMIPRVLGQVIATICMSILGAVVCFGIGLIPVVGSVAGMLASWLFGGYMMARELSGPTCERRGLLRLRERRRLLLQHRASVLGFGIPAFWLLSIPLVSVAVFPAAVAGATLLTRRMLQPA